MCGYGDAAEVDQWGWKQLEAHLFVTERFSEKV